MIELDPGLSLVPRSKVLNQYGYYQAYDDATLDKPTLMQFRHWILTATQH